MGWNLNDLSGSADAPAAASNPTGFVFPARTTQHVVYRGTDNRVVELTWTAAAGIGFTSTPGPRLRSRWGTLPPSCASARARSTWCTREPMDMFMRSRTAATAGIRAISARQATAPQP